MKFLNRQAVCLHWWGYSLFWGGGRGRSYGEFEIALLILFRVRKGIVRVTFLNWCVGCLDDSNEALYIPVYQETFASLVPYALRLRYCGQLKLTQVVTLRLFVHDTGRHWRKTWRHTCALKFLGEVYSLLVSMEITRANVVHSKL